MAANARNIFLTLSSFVVNSVSLKFTTLCKSPLYVSLMLTNFGFFPSALMRRPQRLSCFSRTALVSIFPFLLSLFIEFAENLTEFSCNKMNVCSWATTLYVKFSHQFFSQPCTRNCFSLLPSRSVAEKFLRIQMLFCYV